jgi:hypothetical protein
MQMVDQFWMQINSVEIILATAVRTVNFFINNFSQRLHISASLSGRIISLCNSLGSLMVITS